MWNFLKIEAKNLCAFESLDYNLTQDRTTLVFGKNLDDNLQGSNGSGKSALTEAIAIVLTGEPLRKAKIDEIINDNYDDAVVCGTLYNDEERLQMTIRRKLSRKYAQNIQIRLQRGIEAEDIILPTVDDYNKYILDIIGLSKRDIYTTFILSRNKYVSFLSSSDRDKKELINRFSNGILVDESLEKLNEDIEALQDTLDEAEKALAYNEGVVDNISSQIETAINNRSQFQEERQNKIDEVKASIANNREQIRLNINSINSIEEKNADLKRLNSEIESIETNYESFNDLYEKVNAIWHINSLPDYSDKLNEAQNNISSFEKELTVINERLETSRQAGVSATEIYSTLNAEYQKLTTDLNVKKSHITQQANEYKKKNHEITEKNKELFDLQVQLAEQINSLKRMLSGTIECPVCKYRWIEKCDKHPDELETEIAQLEQNICMTQQQATNLTNNMKENDKKLDDFRTQYRELNETLNNKKIEINNAYATVNKVSNEFSALQSKISLLGNQIFQEKQKITSLKVQLLQYCYDVIAIQSSKHTEQIRQLTYTNETLRGSINASEKFIKELNNNTIETTLDSLKSSLLNAQAKLKTIQKQRNDIKSNLDVLKVQEGRFIEFKTYLANTRIEALANITNEFLAAIGSDIRISFSGYTILKTGKIKDKISINLLRDGIDGGSFGKWSAGEQARVNLANILALWKLCNINCQDGKGLNLLIIDELLDACDEEGLTGMFNALNDLKITSLVISHGNIIENYPHKLLIQKEHGKSIIA